jgi:iron complex outermembrane receptor protein
MTSMSVSMLIRTLTFGLAAVLAAQPGAAQAVPPTQSSTPNQDEGLQEIIVTAERRSERLQDVPIAVSVETPRQLENAGITNMRDLSNAVAGLVTSGVGANVSPAIRGINSQQTDPGNDPNIATYIDGVYQANQLGNAMDFPDISRIEVLKGPQGTLFGRNATGGAIRVFTLEPSLDQATGQFDIGFGNYNDTVAKGFVSAPLIKDFLAASISASYEKEDGWDHDIANGGTSPGIDGRTVRAKILAKPMDGLSLEAFGYYAYKLDGNSTAYEPIFGNTVARAVPGAIIPTQPYHYALNAAPDQESTVYTAGFHASYEFAAGELSSLSSYNQTRAYYYTDGDGSSADIVAYPITERQRELSEELLFTSKKFGMFQFTVGGNYYKDTGKYDPVELSGTAFGINLYGFMQQITSAYAEFGELNFQPTDQWTVTLGARESDERRVATGKYFVANAWPASLPAIGEVTYRSFTPRVSVRYRLTEEDDNVYYTYSQGFKSGGFDISALQPTPFKPERLLANEVGLKTSPTRILSANVSAFYYNYTNQQVMANVGGLNVTSNAASSHIYGADADIIGRVTSSLSVRASLSGLHSSYSSYPNAVVLEPAGPPGCACGNATVTGVNLTGQPLPFSPKFTYSLGPDYKQALSPGTLDMSAFLYSNSGYHYDQRNLQPEYLTLGFRASFEPTDSKFDYYIWGKNLTSRRYYYSTFISNFGDLASYAQPISFGVGVHYAF